MVTPQNNPEQEPIVESMTLGKMPDSDIRLIITADGNTPVYADLITKQADGNPGAANVLKQLLEEGSQVFDRVAPNLGTGNQVWEKYKDECRQSLPELINRYSSTQE